MRKAKKGEMIGIRVTKTQKRLFSSRCRGIGLNTSEVMRGFINKAMSMDRNELKRWLKT